MNRRRITSADEMKALAHPLRLELLELLVVHGPMTASDAATQLDQTPANVSWHLRMLGRHGFVRQATSGPGRRRPWKIVAESLSWGDDAEDPAVTAALRDVVLEREFQRLRTALSAGSHETSEWREATAVHQSRLWLTAAEATEIGQQIQALWTAVAERGSDPNLRPEGARVVALMGWIVPDGPIRPTEVADSAPVEVPS